MQQCTIQFLGAPDNFARTCIFLNILKYISGFPPIWLAAYASLGNFSASMPSTIAMMASVNTIFSFLWDTIMDWGAISYSRPLGSFIFRRRNYLPSALLWLAVPVNLMLRFSWAANRFSWFKDLHPSHFVLLIEVAEVIRRTIWNFFRVEWEVIVVQERLAQNKDVEERAPLVEKELA